MARRSDQRTPEEIQALAINAAEYIIATEGLKAISARNVAKHMGYTPRMIYVVFENLKEIKLRVNDRTLVKLRQSLKDSILRCRTSETCIKAMANTYYQFAVDYQPFWTLLFSIHPPGTRIPDWYRERIDSIFKLVESQLPTEYSKRQNAIIARTLWSSVHGICILSLSDKLAITHSSSAKGMIDSLITNYLAGVQMRQHDE